MTENLWPAAEAALATKGTLTGTQDWSATGLSIDSRSIDPGDLFIALKAARDGHEFVAKALEQGASAALVSRPMDGLPSDAALLMVEDTQIGLEALGIHRRAAVDAQIVAITGSVGKTGTKEALHRALSRLGKTHASVKSFNNMWGVPLTLARMPRDVDFGIFEIGMNHANEITPLTRQVRPHVAIITTVQPVHLENFESIDGIAEAKAEIFHGLEPDGTAILNRDIPHFDLLSARASERGAGRILSFGEGAGADIRLADLVTEAGCLKVAAEIDGRRISYRIGAPGRHLALNSLAVLGAVSALGGDVEEAMQALGDWSPSEGRGHRIRVSLSESESFELVDESYNANPASMAAAISTLGDAVPGAGGRRIAVLGDMLELGPKAATFHADLAGPLEVAGVDLVFCAGPLQANLWEALPETRRGGYGQASTDIAGAIAAVVKPGDIIMVKGSLGSNMRPIVDALLAKDRGQFRSVREMGLSRNPAQRD